MTIGICIYELVLLSIVIRPGASGLWALIVSLSIKLTSSATRGGEQEENERMVKGRPKPTPVKAAAEVIFDPMATGARKPRRPGAPSSSKERHSFMVCLCLSCRTFLFYWCCNSSMLTVEPTGVLMLFVFPPSRDRVFRICIGSQLWRNLLTHLMRSLRLTS